MSIPKPGEIYWGCIPGIEEHRLIVVSREILNRGDYLVVVPITSERFEQRHSLRNCVRFEPGEYGLTELCVAQAENIQLRDIADVDIDGGPIARIDEERMRDIVRAIGYVVASDCEAE